MAIVRDLSAMVAALPDSERGQLAGLYAIETEVGTSTIPEPFRPRVSRWLQHAGGVALPDLPPSEAWRRAEAQTLVCVTNLWANETTHFNALRACRPVVGPPAADADDAGTNDAENMDEFDQEIADNEGIGSCDFCDVENCTAKELWGRVETAHTVSCSNAFKASGSHGVLIFKHHHPLAQTAATVCDAARALDQWYRKVLTDGSRAAAAPWVYPVAFWNVLHRASGSQLHGHMQMQLSPQAGRPEGQLRQLHAAARAYAAAGTSAGGEPADYLDGLIAAHEALGLAVWHGNAVVLAALTPRVALAELMVVGRGAALGSTTDFGEALFLAVDALTRLQQPRCRSFSLVVYPPAIAGVVDGDGTESPTGEAPAASLRDRSVARLWDRGPLDSRQSDVGALELQGISCATADPFRTVELVQRAQAQFKRQRGARDAV